MYPDDVSIGVGFSKPIAVLNCDLRLSATDSAAYEIYFLPGLSPDSTDTGQCNPAFRFDSLFDEVKDLCTIDENWISVEGDHEKRFHCCQRI